MLTICSVLGSIGNARATATPLYLDVMINGWNSGISALFYVEDNTFSAQPDELKRFIHKIPEDLQRTSEGHLVLNHPKLRVNQYNRQQQQLYLDIDPQLFQTQHVKLARHPQREHAQMMNAAWINSEVYFDTEIGGNDWSGGIRADLNGRWKQAQITSEHIIQRLPELGYNTVRLNTTVAWDDLGDLTSLSIGDTFTEPYSGERSLRIAGIKYEKNFSLKPNLITFPTPIFGTTSAIPSVIDLYINELQTQSGYVGPGPVQFIDTPYVSGLGEARIVTTDLLGRQQIVSQPFYIATQLLQDGMSDYSISAGFGRENFANKSFDYKRDPLVTGTYKFGLTDYLTTGAMTSLTNGYRSFGIEATSRLGFFGVLGLRTHYEQASGTQQHHINYQYDGHHIRLNLDWLKNEEGYTDLAGHYNDIITPSGQFNGSLSLYHSDYGSLSLAYIKRSYTERDNRRNSTQLSTITYSKSFGSLNTFINANRDISNDEWSMSLNISYTFDNADMVSVSHQNSRTSPAYQQAQYSIGSRGYNAVQVDTLATRGLPEELVQANARWQSNRHSGYFGARSQGDQTRAFGSFQNAIVTDGESSWISAPIRQSFAVVSVAGHEGIPIHHAHRWIGNTDADGKLLVPTLISGLRNTFSFDPTSLPLDANFPTSTVSAIPQGKGGITVQFDITRNTPPYLRVTQVNGELLKAGSTLVDDQGNNVYVGWNGEVFISSERYPLTLENDDCRLILEAPPDDQPVVRKSVTCQEPKS